MLLQIKTKKMAKEDIEAWHNNCFREANKYFNRIYDWGDEHGIKIDTIVKTQTDVNAQIQPQEETQPQNNNLIK